MTSKPVDPVWFQATVDSMDGLVHLYWSIRSEIENGTGGHTPPDVPLLRVKLATVVEAISWVVGSGTSLIGPRLDGWWTAWGGDEAVFAGVAAEAIIAEFAGRCGYSLDNIDLEWEQPDV